MRWLWIRRRPRQVGRQIIVRNTRAAPIVVRIEPWAEENVIQPGRALHLWFAGPPGHAIEVENDGDDIVVYGWVSSTYEGSRETI